MKNAHKRVANRFLNKTARYRSMLKQTDEGFRYIGADTYSKRDLVRLWGKGQPFHYIEDMSNGSMEDQEIIVQVFPKQSKAEIHLKGITETDESDGNFVTHHGLTFFKVFSVESADQLYTLVENFDPKTLIGKSKSIYWQTIENDGNWQ